MVDRKKLCRMIALARFETKNEDKAIRINNSYEQDYIARALIRNFLLTSIAYVLLIMVIGMVNLDVWLSNLNNLNIQPLLLTLILGYLIMLGVYTVIAFTIARIRYVRARNGIQQYRYELEQLRRIYKEEDSVLRRGGDDDEDEDEDEEA